MMSNCLQRSLPPLVATRGGGLTRSGKTERIALARYGLTLGANCALRSGPLSLACARQLSQRESQDRCCVWFCAFANVLCYSLPPSDEGGGFAVRRSRRERKTGHKY